jgi:hypothetical protein
MKAKLLGDSARYCSAINTIMPSLFAACCLLIAVGFVPANAATITYTDSAAYFAAAGHQTLQDFNSPISNTATSITYNDLVVSCSGPFSCGTSSSVSIDGLSVGVTSPSLLTFTFHSPITSFGIYIAGLGTISPGSTTLSIANSNGFYANLFTDYSGTTTNFNDALFGGLISDTRFTSVTIAGTEGGDGIFFDNLSYSSAVPLPPTAVLFATGLAALGVLGWHRKRKNVAAIAAA